MEIWRKVYESERNRMVEFLFDFRAVIIHSNQNIFDIKLPEQQSLHHYKNPVRCSFKVEPLSEHSYSAFMKPKHQRLLLIFLTLAGLGIASSLVLVAFQDSLVFFYTPSDVVNKAIPSQQRIRVGGLVEIGSTQRAGQQVHFKITDRDKVIEVTYDGLLPDLFREGQGVVAEGYLTDSRHFNATTVLAKHDETYMPKEVAEGLRDECKQ